MVPFWDTAVNHAETYRREAVCEAMSAGPSDGCELGQIGKVRRTQRHYSANAGMCASRSGRSRVSSEEGGAGRKGPQRGEGSRNSCSVGELGDARKLHGSENTLFFGGKWSQGSQRVSEIRRREVRWQTGQLPRRKLSCTVWYEAVSLTDAWIA